MAPSGERTGNIMPGPAWRSIGRRRIAGNPAARAGEGLGGGDGEWKENCETRRLRLPPRWSSPASARGDAVAHVFGIKERCGMSLPAEKPLPDADELPFWRRKPMKDMTPAEWESLCDGCGRCCLNKLQEEGSDRTYYTDVGCKLLDGQSCRCTDYTNRSAKVKDCVTLTTRNINRISWL